MQDRQVVTVQLSADDLLDVAEVETRREKENRSKGRRDQAHGLRLQDRIRAGGGERAVARLLMVEPWRGGIRRALAPNGREESWDLDLLGFGKIEIKTRLTRGYDWPLESMNENDFVWAAGILVWITDDPGSFDVMGWINKGGFVANRVVMDRGHTPTLVCPWRRMFPTDGFVRMAHEAAWSGRGRDFPDWRQHHEAL